MNPTAPPALPNVIQSLPSTGTSGGAAATGAAALGATSGSMRTNYDTHGVDGYYTQVGASYRNPHFPGLKQCTRVLMDAWVTPGATNVPLDHGVWPAPAADGGPAVWRMLDLAAGSGEATVAIDEWLALRSGKMTMGAVPGATITVPEPAVGATTPVPMARPPVVTQTPVPRPGVALTRPPVSRPGSARRTAAAAPAFPESGIVIEWTAADPYTQEAYTARTGRECHDWSFEDVAGGVVDEEMPGTVFDIVVFSFALHLLDASKLFGTLDPLARRAKYLVVLSPHKKPDISETTGWALVHEAYSGGAGNNRVHGRLFQSLLFSGGDE
ncbi:hypothetical protein H9P43_000413 [Blastocladiella emersonii ATCC 22665]|nr:hypothetical protein H9P43_000413 [Blastocladiella emersonii ATCC 22665]